MGSEELTKEERKKYICVSTAVSDLVTAVYLRHRADREQG